MPLVMGCIVLESRREPIDLLAIDYTCLVAFLLDFLQLDNDRVVRWLILVIFDANDHLGTLTSF